MTKSDLKTSSLSSRVTDILVLAVSFLLLTLITDFTDLTSLLSDMMLFVSVLFVCLRLSKRISFEYLRSSRRFVNVLLGNVTGLIVGGVVMFGIYKFFPGMVENMMIIILSSVLAFFILGTLSPMVKSSHKDIISH